MRGHQHNRKLARHFLVDLLTSIRVCYSVCGKSLGCELMLKHYYHHKDFVLSVSVKVT